MNFRTIKNQICTKCGIARYQDGNNWIKTNSTCVDDKGHEWGFQPVGPQPCEAAVVEAHEAISATPIEPTLFVETEVQKVLFEKELRGQISDGAWENASPINHWEPWSACKVEVVGNGPTGRNFDVKKANYRFTSIVPVVGDRMLQTVVTELGVPYDEKQLVQDLRKLTNILKTTC